MRILHLIAGDLTGGAARGAYWLHSAQREIGIDSVVITSGRGAANDPSVISLASSSVKKLKFALYSKLGSLPKYLYWSRESWIFNTGFEGVDFTKLRAYREADLINLHWINGLVSMRTLQKVDKPIVWTMRDMWPLTGGCHYSLGCDRYKVGCGRCPQLRSKRDRDLTRLVVANKRASFPRQLRVIGISHWLSQCAAESQVFAGFSVETISNNVDTQQFVPIDRKTARRALGLPSRKKIVLAGAQCVTSFYKGFDLFLSALGFLRGKGIHVLLFGRVADLDLTDLAQDYTNLGFLPDTISLRLAYSAADVFVAPSRMDAFGKTLVEAMACGTPVVCFDATGPKDIVEHQVTGYKAEPFKTIDLAKGIEWILDRSALEQEGLRRHARERATAYFDSHVIARQYRELYARVLGKA